MINLEVSWLAKIFSRIPFDYRGKPQALGTDLSEVLKEVFDGQVGKTATKNPLVRWMMEFHLAVKAYYARNPEMMAETWNVLVSVTTQLTLDALSDQLPAALKESLAQSDEIALKTFSALQEVEESFQPAFSTPSAYQDRVEKSLDFGLNRLAFTQYFDAESPIHINVNESSKLEVNLGVHKESIKATLSEMFPYYYSPALGEEMMANVSFDSSGFTPHLLHISLTPLIRPEVDRLMQLLHINSDIMNSSVIADAYSLPMGALTEESESVDHISNAIKMHNRVIIREQIGSVVRSESLSPALRGHPMLPEFLADWVTLLETSVTKQEGWLPSEEKHLIDRYF